MSDVQRRRWTLAGGALALACLLGGGPTVAQDPTFDDAIAALKAGDYVAAATGFETLVERNSTWASGFLSLGQCYYMLGRSDEGRSKLEEAHQLDPTIDLYAQFYAVGQTLYGKQSYERAIPPLERALAHAPPAQRSPILARLAHANLKLERYAEAREILEAQGELDPSSHYNLAIACQQMGDYDAALSNLRSLRDAENPPSDGVLASLARWSRYWALKPSHVSSRIALLNQAAEDTRSWYTADPTSDEALRLHTDVLVEAGRSDEVIAGVLPRANANPGDCAARLTLAQAYNTRRAWAEAEAWARKEIACFDRSVDGRLELVAALLFQVHEDFSSTAEIEADLKRVREADEVVAQALRIDPDDARAQGLARDVAEALSRLQLVADDLRANDADNAAAATRQEQAEIRERCRNILWSMRDENTEMSAEDKAVLEKHDCKQRATQ